MNLSETMGAVTHLAFGNGYTILWWFSVGDAITAIVASTSPGGINNDIGSLFGAGMFVTTFIVGVAILLSGHKGV